MSDGSFAAAGGSARRARKLFADLGGDRHDEPLARRFHLRRRLLLVRVLDLGEVRPLPHVRAAGSDRARAPCFELARSGLERIAVGDDALREHRVGAVGRAELRKVNLDRPGRARAVDVPKLHDALQTEALVHLALAVERLGADGVHRELAPFAEDPRLAVRIEAIARRLAAEKTPRSPDRLTCPPPPAHAPGFDALSMGGGADPCVADALSLLHAASPQADERDRKDRGAVHVGYVRQRRVEGNLLAPRDGPIMKICIAAQLLAGLTPLMGLKSQGNRRAKFSEVGHIAC